MTQEQIKTEQAFFANVAQNEFIQALGLYENSGETLDTTITIRFGRSGDRTYFHAWKNLGNNKSASIKIPQSKTAVCMALGLQEGETIEVPVKVIHQTPRSLDDLSASDKKRLEQTIAFMSKNNYSLEKYYADVKNKTKRVMLLDLTVE